MGVHKLFIKKSPGCLGAIANCIETVSRAVSVEASKGVFLTPLRALSSPALFGNHVLEKTKIVKNPLFFILLWQSWGQGFDSPQLHQVLFKKRKGPRLPQGLLFLICAYFCALQPQDPTNLHQLLPTYLETENP